VTASTPSRLLQAAESPAFVTVRAPGVVVVAVVAVVRPLPSASHAPARCTPCNRTARPSASSSFFLRLLPPSSSRVQLPPQATAPVLCCTRPAAWTSSTAPSPTSTPSSSQIQEITASGCFWRAFWRDYAACDCGRRKYNTGRCEVSTLAGAPSMMPTLNDAPASMR
jgi:hypothetical protein